MATNIIELIQQKLGYPELQKIDPNVQQVTDDTHSSTQSKLAQAAIPTVIAGIYKLSITSGGLDKIRLVKNEDDPLALLFAGKELEVVEKVAQYSGITEGEAESALTKISNTAFNFVQSENENDSEKMKSYIAEQRHNTLIYLPASLGIGFLLEDDGLDDKTNKMEGPISNLMHKIEGKFAGSGE